MGNYPWFVTFNYLQANVPKYDGVKGLARNAFIGMCASCVSDCVSNSLRVVKTIKQTNSDANLGYVGAVKSVIEKDGVKGLFGREPEDRAHHQLLAQSMVFSVFWKAIEQKLNEAAEKKASAKGKTGSMTLAHLPELGGRVPPAQARLIYSGAPRKRRGREQHTLEGGGKNTPIFRAVPSITSKVKMRRGRRERGSRDHERCLSRCYYESALLSFVGASQLRRRFSSFRRRFVSTPSSPPPKSNAS